MFELLKRSKPVTVEQIHEEFDSGQERILNECDRILAELKIPTETQIERKAKLLKELGFVNSETIKQAETLMKHSKGIEVKLEITSKQASLIRGFTANYPLEKFITVEELDRICEKYNLIHAPIVNYVKDIPEKNLLEIKKCKKLEKGDKLPVSVKLLGLESKYLLRLFDKVEPIFSTKDMALINYPYKDILINWLSTGSTTWGHVAVQHGVGSKPGKAPHYDDYGFKGTEIVDKTGLFIAAPKSHFNLEGLTKTTKHGFFTVTKQEVKDPVVFEFCKEGIVRIISKWGTDDDQSYLDPALLNESHN